MMAPSKIFCKIALVVLTSGLFTACGDDYKTSTKEQLEAYLEKDHPGKDTGSEKFSAYFDFSDGMQYAYADDDTKEVLKAIVNKVAPKENFAKYSLADNKITELPSQMTDLYNTIMDDRSYTKQFAPIQQALEQIVTNGQSALMITDFEEYTGKMEKVAFATPSFNKWLEAGNEITFFVTDYQEQGKDKHLYYIIFDTPEQNLLKIIEEAGGEKLKSIKRFNLSTKAYSLTTDYLTSTKGGNYHNAQGEDNVTAVIEDGKDEAFQKFEAYNAEFYPLGDSWTNIVFNARSLQEEGVEASDRFEHLFSKLYLDVSKFDSYIIKGLDIHVTNIQQDFGSYCNFLQAQNDTKHKEDYYDEKGKILPNYQYKPSEGTGIKDMLLFDKSLFETGMKSTPDKIELAINLDSKFEGTLVGAEPADMLRVDIYIAECEPNYSRIPELFSWSNNDNLSYSIRNTLQDMRPIGRVIYSYFIRGTK